ncbi:MAG: ABC transporter ATP-binding protein [Clostridia bacterium]
MLKINNLTKTYGGNGKPSVDNLTLEVKDGEIFGFIGPNGAGKSTTIKCITGIVSFEGGSVQVDGIDLKNSPIEAKRQIGYVSDDHILYEGLTGVEFVNFICDIFNVSAADREVRLKKYLELFALEDAIGKQIKSYSHGMKQKICIIAALIHEPKLWVLDEPMMGLDPQSTAEIVSYMREHCAKGNTVFFSSHNLDLVKKLCHRVAIINEGHLIDCFDLQGNDENKANLEERFFRITGTYEKRLFEDYVAQESADMRPDLPVADADKAIDSDNKDGEVKSNDNKDNEVKAVSDKKDGASKKFGARKTEDKK